MKNIDAYKTLIEKIKETAQEIIDTIDMKPVNIERLGQLEEQMHAHLEEGANYIALLEMKTRYLNYMPQYK